MTTSHNGPAAEPDPAGDALPDPGWRPTPAAALAVDRLAEVMRSWRALGARPGLRVGVVYDAPVDRSSSTPWTRTAAELAWLWATAAADSAPRRDSVWTTTISTTAVAGSGAPLSQAVAVVCDRAGLVGTTVTARLLVLITGADVDPDELAATRAWLDDLRGIGCATLWLCPSTVAHHPGEILPGATVHLVDPERPYAAGMLGAAADEALDRAAAIRQEQGRSYDASARVTAREFHDLTAQVASALGDGWAAVPYDGGPPSARHAILRGPGGIELAVIRGRVPGHWHIEGRLTTGTGTGTGPDGPDGMSAGSGTDLQSPPCPLVPVGSTPEQVAEEIRLDYLDAWTAYTVAYAAALATGSGS